MRNQILAILMILVLACISGCDKSEPKPSPEMAEFGKQLISMQNLREIGQAGYSYMMEHDGVPAPSLEVLVEEGLLKAEYLVSPMSGRARSRSTRTASPSSLAIIYICLAVLLRKQQAKA